MTECHNRDCSLSATATCIDCEEKYCPECMEKCSYEDEDTRCGEPLCYFCKDQSERDICARCAKDKKTSMDAAASSRIPPAKG